jgi:hypothetical protein
MNEIEMFAFLYSRVLEDCMENPEQMAGRPKCPICGLPMARMATQMADARWLYSWLCNCITPDGEDVDADIYAHDKGINDKTSKLMGVLGER